MPKPDPVVNKIRKALEGCAATEIAGGPVTAPLDALDTVWLLALFCNAAVRCALQITPRVQKKPKALSALPGNTRPEHCLEEFSKAAKEAQEGDTLEVLCASEADVYDAKDDLDDYGTGRSTREIAEIKTALRQAAKQRYAGPVDSGHTWRITSSWPAVDAATLKDVLELLAKVKGIASEWARDEPEARAVLELTRQSTEFPLRNPHQVRENSVEVRGREIVVQPHRRPALAMMFLRHRYPNGPWNIKTRQQEEAFWVKVENENERRTKERMQQKAPA